MHIKLIESSTCRSGSKSDYRTGSQGISSRELRNAHHRTGGGATEQNSFITNADYVGEAPRYAHNVGTPVRIRYPLLALAKALLMMSRGSFIFS